MKISYVIPCYKSEETIEAVVLEIKGEMDRLNRYTYEIILVNDASPDNTMEKIKYLCTEYENITGVELAKNFGQHSAVMAGISLATGDIICCLDDDGQTPANEVGKLLDKIEEGYDVVYARYPIMKKAAWRSFGTLINKKMTESMLNKPKELEITSYFCMKSFIAREILKYKNSYPYLMGLVLRSTKNICNVDVNHRARTVGKSGYSLFSLIALWINGFTAFSVKPLRIATFTGVFVAICGFIYAIWAIIHKIINPIAPMGWSSTIALTLILGGAILFVLGIIGEYIGRIYICINNSPQYVIRKVYTKE